MKVEIKNWHGVALFADAPTLPSLCRHDPSSRLPGVAAVASWTWTSEDDVCGICHMPLDGCAPGAIGPGDDSPVVWGRVRAPPQLRTPRFCTRDPATPYPALSAAAVHALLSPHVHRDVAEQQEHMSTLS